MRALAALDEFYEKHGYLIAVAACFLFPLKLSLAYIFLVALILLWLLHTRCNPRALFITGSVITIPFAAFVVVALCSAPFSIDPLRSFNKLSGVIFFGLSIAVFRDIVRTYDYGRLLFALVAGQTVAAAHSVLEGAFGWYVPRIFIGAVSESGQLSLSVIIACGLTMLHASEDVAGSKDKRYWVNTVLGIVNYAVFTTLAFSRVDRTSPLLFGALLAAALGLLLLTLHRHRLIRSEDVHGEARIVHLLQTLILPLLLAALLVNLKRGPWMGVLVGGLAFLYLEHRRLTLPLLAVAAALLFTIQPVQERVAKSEEHFFIVGGRSEIWDIGVDLARRYPLGVGYRNSGFLQKFSDDIPSELTHFHNNFLNVLVETGWLGLACYLWWIFAMLQVAFCKRPQGPVRILSQCLGCAILSWQVAGLVEYNFGDSEVVMLAFIVSGMLAALECDHTSSAALQKNAPSEL